MTQQEINQQLQDEIAKLRNELFKVTDLYFRQNPIDKTVFSNPVYFNGKLIVIPKCSGTPTNTNVENGSMMYDVTNSKLCTFNSGTWTCGSLGGSGGVAGSDTEIQFNDTGVMTGAQYLLWDKNNNQLAIGDGSGGFFYLNGQGPGDFNINVTDNLTITADDYIQMFSGTKDLILSSTPIATNSNIGFIRIQICAGTPTGTPANVDGKAMVYDTTNNKLWIYNGAWKSVTLT